MQHVRWNQCAISYIFPILVCFSICIFISSQVLQELSSHYVYYPHLIKLTSFVLKANNIGVSGNEISALFRSYYILGVYYVKLSLYIREKLVITPLLLHKLFNKATLCVCLGIKLLFLVYHLTLAVAMTQISKIALRNEVVGETTQQTRNKRESRKILILTWFKTQKRAISNINNL